MMLNIQEYKSLSYSDHIVLATFGVRYDSRFVIDVLYKKFTKLLTDPCINRFEMKHLLEPRQRLGLFIKIDKIHD